MSEKYQNTKSFQAENEEFQGWRRTSDNCLFTLTPDGLLWEPVEDKFKKFEFQKEREREMVDAAVQQSDCSF